MTMLAYRGRRGCTNSECTRLFSDADTPCTGWHCGVCHEPSSEQGHFGECPQEVV